VSGRFGVSFPPRRDEIAADIEWRIRIAMRRAMRRLRLAVADDVLVMPPAMWAPAVK